ncbi:MAG TPA: PspC domain-containing protein, partial [Saprospiraceae bacterium]|nr:PspC domain-containing protein [Saprospiraceae bacterium]
MNKTININLGGRAFVIDEDAYAKLDYYLTSIHDYFKNSEGYEEITNDIESRMGELFADNLRGRSIISTADVDYAIHTMGSLEDFGVDTAGTQANFNTGQRIGGIKTGRRIFRDPDEKILGGVCAGLSSYFGINDPIWLRIIFLLLFFVAGTGFLFYMILWILIPKAVTSADRLSMKGEPININNIAKEVEDSFNHFGQRINDIGREFSGKKKNNLNANEPYAFSGITNFVGELVEA